MILAFARKYQVVQPDYQILSMKVWRAPRHSLFYNEIDAIEKIPGTVEAYFECISGMMLITNRASHVRH